MSASAPSWRGGTAHLPPQELPAQSSRGWGAEGQETNVPGCSKAVKGWRGAQHSPEATEPLSPQDDVCMHLTNYAINKHNENFVRDNAVGSKRYAILRRLPCPLVLVSPAMKLRPALERLTAQENSAFTDPCPVTTKGGPDPSTPDN